MKKEGDPKMKMTKMGFLLGLLGAGILIAGAAMGEPPENWTSGIAYDVIPAAKITKGKPLALEPKEVMVLKWPVFSQEMPKGFALVVKEEKE
jgi:hypothetical protein